MPAKVALLVVGGALEGEKREFDGPGACVVGRGSDCDLRLPNSTARLGVSRHHCRFDMDPPRVVVRDYGSLNGTFVNGEKIGQRAPGAAPGQDGAAPPAERELRDGDRVRVGDTVMEVRILAGTSCGKCGAPLDTGKRWQPESGRPLCERCFLGEGPPAQAPPAEAVDVAVSESPGVAGGPARPLGPAILRLMRESDAKRLGLENITGYEMLDHLGEGGMGAVYLARNRDTGAEVALKVMLPELAMTEQARKRFLLEANITKTMVHPAIVRLLDVSFDRSPFYFTMEYCRGGNLHRHLLRAGGVLPLEEATRIACQVLDGLHYAHGREVPGNFEEPGDETVRGIVHRDLKPANIFLEDTGGGPRAKIGDFGLAKAFALAGFSGLTRTGLKAGTPFFMARQQAKNFKYVKPEVDVYAAAAVYYWMLTGASPRDFLKGEDVWAVVLGKRPVPLLARGRALPPRLAVVLDRALDDEADLFYKSAAALKEDLLGALG